MTCPVMAPNRATQDEGYQLFDCNWEILRSTKYHIPIDLMHLMPRGLLGEPLGSRPFHFSTKHLHHARSARKPQFNETEADECRSVRACRRSIIRWRNERPAHTTLHAWFRWLIKDFSSERVQTFLSPHWASDSLSLCSLSSGRSNWPLMVSVTIPRNTCDGVGPSVCSVTIGIPSLITACSRVLRFCWHNDNSGGPMIR